LCAERGQAAIFGHDWAANINSSSLLVHFKIRNANLPYNWIGSIA
jgi:hypothetical protein